MNVPGLLIEYLVTGGVSLIWLLPFLQLLGFPWQDSLFVKLGSILLIPVLYIVGLLINFLSGHLVSATKRKIRISLIEEHINTNKWYKNFDNDLLEALFETEKKGDTIIKIKKIESRVATIYLWLNCDNLAKGFEMRSSRDRIARSTFLNLFIAAIFVPLTIYISKGFHWKLLLCIILLITLSILFYHIWEESEKSSYRYKIEAVKMIALNKKNTYKT